MMTDRELIHRSRCDDPVTATGARDELTRRYRPLVHGQANRQLARNHADRQDLVSEAGLGLQKAITDYDLEHGTPFAAYAKARVIGVLRNWYRDQRYGPHVPRTHHELHMRVRTAQAELEQDGSDPTVGQIAVHLDITPDDVVEALAVSSAERFRSAQLDAADATTTETVHADLRLLLSRMEPETRGLLHDWYWQDHTQREIADKLDVSQAQVSRLESRALEDLRKAALVPADSPCH